MTQAIHAVHAEPSVSSACRPATPTCVYRTLGLSVLVWRHCIDCPFRTLLLAALAAVRHHRIDDAAGGGYAISQRFRRFYGIFSARYTTRTVGAPRRLGSYLPSSPYPCSPLHAKSLDSNLRLSQAVYPTQDRAAAAPSFLPMHRPCAIRYNGRATLFAL